MDVFVVAVVVEMESWNWVSRVLVVEETSRGKERVNWKGVKSKRPSQKPKEAKNATSLTAGVTGAD